MSCRKEMSPTTRVTPRLRPNAKPAALLSTPSMPLAPLLAATGAPSPDNTCRHTKAISLESHHSGELVFVCDKIRFHQAGIDSLA